MLRVIGAGLPRTGTTSMKAALEHLGFGPCYHMFEILLHPDHVERWLPVAVGPRVDWDVVFDGYQSTQDWPASHFYRELAGAYPEAKVVLTVRDPHAWYPSLRALMQRATAISGPSTATDGTATPAAGGLPPAVEAMSRMTPVLELVGQAYFGPRWRVGADLPDEGVAVAAFHQHVADVRASVAADRLLVFDVREGWAPLCSFLDVPEPSGTPFPHLNDADWMRQAMAHLEAEGHMRSPFVPESPRDVNPHM